MTNPDQQAANERIAVAMGWAEVPGKGWMNPLPDGQWHDALPDYFTDPVAADALMGWLDENEYWWTIENRRVDRAHRRYRAEVRISSGTLCRIDAISWILALALAADAAIQEAAK